jgi:hypothetical protein
MKIRFFTSFLFITLSSLVLAQEDEDWDFEESTSELGPAFYDTRVINSQSVETLEKGTWDVRIAHRFGEMATSGAGKTFFGLDNSSDIAIGTDYAITDKLLVGIHRNKGAGPYSQLMQGIIKYKIFDQSENKPFTLTANSNMFYTLMTSSTDSTSITRFAKSAHRASYFSQLILARNLKDIASIQINLGVLHRNLVYSGDENTNFSIGGVAKLKVAKKISLIAEYNHLFRKTNIVNSLEYVDPLGVGIEFKTFAHVFQLNFTNSRGMGEVQYLSYTTSKWSKGEFRLGFTISRHF